MGATPQGKGYKMNKQTAIIIPARYGSSRLEGKPLLKACNKPIIQWVWEKATQVKSADMVIIATDNQQIYDCAKSFGANVEMTSEHHKCGSDRIVEVAEKYPEISYIINLQGDEPMISTECVETVINLLKNDDNVDISTLLSDLDKETVKWAPNFDDRFLEPTVLPAKFPNLLVNGVAKAINKYVFGE